jgi:hypothetical protein
MPESRTRLAGQLPVYQDAAIFHLAVIRLIDAKLFALSKKVNQYLVES